MPIFYSEREEPIPTPSDRVQEDALRIAFSGEQRRIHGCSTFRYGDYITTIGPTFSSCTCDAGKHDMVCKHVLSARFQLARKRHSTTT